MVPSIRAIVECAGSGAFTIGDIARRCGGAGCGAFAIGEREVEDEPSMALFPTEAEAHHWTESQKETDGQFRKL